MKRSQECRGFNSVSSAIKIKLAGAQHSTSKQIREIKKKENTKKKNHCPDASSNLAMLRYSSKVIFFFCIFADSMRD